jgi:hypothetical protein
MVSREELYELVWSIPLCNSCIGSRANLAFLLRFFDSSSNAYKTKAAIARGLCRLTDLVDLLGCHFFGFAFLPHQLQLALGFLEGGRDFLLHAGSGFFEFLR